MDELCVSYAAYRDPPRRYHLQDTNWNVVATLGVVSGVMRSLEAIRYDPYGLAYFYDANANWTGYATPPNDWESPEGTDVAFQGRWYWKVEAPGEGRLRLYDFRHRTYAPKLGRFLQRDPLGPWGDGANLGNGYGFVGGMPVVRTDPSGRVTWNEFIERIIQAVAQECRASAKTRKVDLDGRNCKPYCVACACEKVEADAARLRLVEFVVEALGVIPVPGSKVVKAVEAVAIEAEKRLIREADRRWISKEVPEEYRNKKNFTVSLPVDCTCCVAGLEGDLRHSPRECRVEAVLDIKDWNPVGNISVRATHCKKLVDCCLTASKSWVPEDQPGAEECKQEKAKKKR